MSKAHFFRGFDLIWTKDVPGFPHFSLKNNTIFSKIGGVLYGLHPSNGKALWSFNYEYTTGSSIETDYDDYIYAINNDSYRYSKKDNKSIIYSINRTNGEILWKISLPEHINYPAQAGKVEVIYAFRGDLVALDKFSGKQKWYFPNLGNRVMFLEIYKDFVVFVVNDLEINKNSNDDTLSNFCSIYILDIQSGKVLKRFQEYASIGKVCISKGNIFYECGKFDNRTTEFQIEYIKSISLRSLKPYSNILYVEEMESHFDIHNGSILTLKDDTLKSKKLSGEIQWQRKISGLETFITFYDSGILYLLDQHYLFALDPENGELFWEKSLPHTNTISKPFIYKGLMHFFKIN